MNLSERAITRQIGNVIGLEVVIGRVGVPGFVVRMEGDVDFEEGFVGIGRDNEGLGRGVGLVMDLEPVGGRGTRRVGRNGEDEISRRWRRDGGGGGGRGGGGGGA